MNKIELAAVWRWYSQIKLEQTITKLKIHNSHLHGCREIEHEYYLLERKNYNMLLEAQCIFLLYPIGGIDGYDWMAIGEKDALHSPDTRTWNKNKIIRMRWQKNWSSID